MVRTKKKSQLNTPPPQLTKCGILTLEETPARKPLKLSSLNYKSPIGNVSQPMKTKEKKSFTDQSISLVPIAPFPDVQKNKANSRMLLEQGTANTCDDFVIPDTSEAILNQTRLLHKAVKNSLSHSTMETDNSDQNGSKLIVRPESDRYLPRKLRHKKHKKALPVHDERLLCDVSETSTRNSELTHGSTNTHSDDCVNVDLESFMGTDDNANKPISDVPVPISPFSDVQKNKANTRMLLEQGTANSCDVIVTQDTPEAMQNQTRLLHKAVKNSQSHSTMETDNSVELVPMNRFLKRKLRHNKRKQDLHNERLLSDILHETITRINCEPAHGSTNTQPDLHSDNGVNLGSESFVVTDDNVKKPISDVQVPISLFSDVQKNKANSRMLLEQGTANTCDVIVIQDTPEPMQNQTRLLHKAVKNSQSHSTMETDNSDQNGSKLIVDLVPMNRFHKRKLVPKKLRRALHNERLLCDILHETCARINCEPAYGSTNTQSNLSVDWDGFMYMKDNSIKKKKRKRKRMLMPEQDVNSSIANESIVVDHSPPEKERKVLLLDGNRCTEKLLAVHIQNNIVDALSDNDIEVTASNMTIDLEPDSVESVGLSAPDVAIIAEGNDIPTRRKKKARHSGLDNTIITLSDGEDTNDIVVLGSPVVPSVNSYKEIKSRKPPTMDHPKFPRTGGQVHRPSKTSSRWDKLLNGYQSRLNRTVEQTRMNNNIVIGNIPLGGIKTTVASTNAQQTVASTNVQQAVPPSPANEFGSNLYNPSVNVVEKTGLRPVIIDGSNIAMGHGNGRIFSCRGIEICVNYFKKKGHKVFAFVPQFRRHNHYTKDAHILEQLSSSQTVIFTPSRLIDGRHEVPYDDRYIVQTAAELGGVIVSTDNYRDLLNENQTWHDVIKNRLLMFTWVEDLLIFPQDPLGRRGGNLEAFLRFPK